MCNYCSKPLNQSQYNEERNMKSCPNCSTNNGDEHVFYEYPLAFGNTPTRETVTNPDGPQSYCIACRGNQPVVLTPTLCSNI